MTLSNETILALYRKMLVVRNLEETHGKFLQEGKIQLMPHFGTGQEAVSIGVTGPLQQKDILFGTHRGVGEYVGKGMTTKDIWAEYLGKQTGLCKGKGTMHLCDPNLNIPGLVSSLGSDFSYAVGTALSSKMNKSDQVTLFFVGEGTCNQGDAGPAMCMAALWKCPVVFAICTNEFCELSYKSEHIPTEDVAPRAAGYGIPYDIVDGQDIETTYTATEKAISHARSSKGPYVVEYKTFRMALHYAGDPGGYVKSEDVEKWSKRDPIDICREKLLDRGVLTNDQDQKLVSEVQAEVNMTAKEAMADPDPVQSDLFKDVYANKGVF